MTEQFPLKGTKTVPLRGNKIKFHNPVAARVQRSINQNLAEQRVLLLSRRTKHMVINSPQWSS